MVSHFGGGMAEVYAVLEPADRARIVGEVKVAI